MVFLDQDHIVEGNVAEHAEQQGQPATRHRGEQTPHRAGPVVLGCVEVIDGESRCRTAAIHKPAFDDTAW